MHKDKLGNIGFNSTLEHRCVERIRHNLKSSGIEEIKTQYHDDFVYIMTGIYNSEIIKIHILIRKVASNFVAMNRDSFNCDRKYGINSLLILGDRRHLYPIKFMFFNNINNIEYKDFPVPRVLIPEEDFVNIKELRDVLELREFS